MVQKCPTGLFDPGVLQRKQNEIDPRNESFGSGLATGPPLPSSYYDGSAATCPGAQMRDNQLLFGATPAIGNWATTG